jgi:hypothetical protein
MKTCNIYSDSRGRAWRFCRRQETEFPCSFALKERSTRAGGLLLDISEVAATLSSILYLFSTAQCSTNRRDMAKGPPTSTTRTNIQERQPSKPKFAYWHYATILMVNAIILLLDFDLNFLSPRLNSKSQSASPTASFSLQIVMTSEISLTVFDVALSGNIRGF